MMKWLDPEIQLVVCGSSFREMPTFGEWERTVLRHTYEYVDYLSLHTYYTNMEDDIPSFLASNRYMDRFIKEVGVICDEIKAEKRASKDIKLSFDEWNVWYHYKKSGAQPPKWTVARPIEEERYDFADALLVGSMLITLINNADLVKIACMAQLVNTLAPIMTEPAGRAWVQTTYFPFLYTSQNGRGTALQADLASPAYDCAAGEVPYIDCAAVLSPSGDEINLFLVNKHLEQDIACKVTLADFAARTLRRVSMHGYALDAVNTAAHSPVAPIIHESIAVDKDIAFTLPKASWNMITLSKDVIG